MKHIYLFLITISISITSFAQDSLITIHSFSSELNVKSQRTPEGKYFRYIPIRMQTGDKIIAIYGSDNFEPALIIQDSLGDAVNKNDKPTNNKISITFSAPYDMLYYFNFTTKDPEKTGKYKVKLYYYHKQADTISIKSSLCAKLQYLALHSRTNFKFLLKGTGLITNSFEPAIPQQYLLSPKEGNERILFDGNTPTYECIAIEVANKTSADSIYNDVTNCLEGYFKVLEKNGTTTVYKLEGNELDDLNNMHTLMNVQSTISLRYYSEDQKHYVDIVVQ